LEKIGALLMSVFYDVAAGQSRSGNGLFGNSGGQQFKAFDFKRDFVPSTFHTWSTLQTSSSGIDMRTAILSKSARHTTQKWFCNLKSQNHCEQNSFCVKSLK